MSKNELKNRQMALYKQYKATGCRKAHADLIETFNGLVYKLATRLLPSGIPRDDLVSEGFLAVCEAIELFDKDRGSLSGVVYATIKTRLDKQSRTLSRAVTTPKGRKEENLRWHLARKIREYEQQGFGHTRALELSANDIGVSASHAACAMAIRSSVPFETSGDNDETRQFAVDEPPVDETLDVERVREILLDAMSGLDEREKHVLRMRIFSEEFVSLDAVAEGLGVSRGRASQIQHDAQEHVRIELKMRGLSLGDLI